MTLQKWIENEALLISNKLDEAIANGASLRKPFAGALCIDNVYVTTDLSGNPQIVLKLNSDRIAHIFEPDADEPLEERDKLQEKIDKINAKIQNT